jgi:hypothetical protein
MEHLENKAYKDPQDHLVHPDLKDFLVSLDYKD